MKRNHGNTIDEYRNDELAKHVRSLLFNRMRTEQIIKEIDEGKKENCVLYDGITYRDKLVENLNTINEQLNSESHVTHMWKRYGYDWKERIPQKDNSGYGPVYGGGFPTDSRVRVPSLKRKTAWKRFYRMFPNLEGLDKIPGCSSCSSAGWPRGLNDSTIKLKKSNNKKKQ